MSDEFKTQINEGKAIDRAAVLTLLEVGIAAGEMRFVRQVAEDWLDAYPYDLHVELMRARALMQENKTETAVKILMRLCQLDPEFREAQELLAKLARRVQPGASEQARAAAAVVAYPAGNSNDIQAWGLSASCKPCWLKTRPPHCPACCISRSPSSRA
jgi:predicted Zn-dependent protease